MCAGTMPTVPKAQCPGPLNPKSALMPNLRMSNMMELKMMKMLKGSGAKKMMRQMEAMRGRGGFPGM